MQYITLYIHAQGMHQTNKVINMLLVRINYFGSLLICEMYTFKQRFKFLFIFSVVKLNKFKNIGSIIIIALRNGGVI